MLDSNHPEQTENETIVILSCLVPQERLLPRKGYDAVMVLGTGRLIAHTEIGKCSAVVLRTERR